MQTEMLLLFLFKKIPFGFLPNFKFRLNRRSLQRGFLKLSKHTLISYLIVSTVFAGSGILFLFNPFGAKEAEAAWFNDNWGYRIGPVTGAP